MTQRELYELFETALRRTEADSPRYDALADALDLIHGGPWAKGRALYPEPLSE